MITMKGTTMNTKQQPQTALPQEQRQPCEVWTRVMGYHRPVASFNTGKQAEYAERTFFSESPCSPSAD
jgi:anaerobic ribonucleoside-triphosphate reductase